MAISRYLRYPIFTPKRGGDFDLTIGRGSFRGSFHCSLELKKHTSNRRHSFDTFNKLFFQYHYYIIYYIIVILEMILILNSLFPYTNFTMCLTLWYHDIPNLHSIFDWACQISAIKSFSSFSHRDPEQPRCRWDTPKMTRNWREYGKNEKMGTPMVSQVIGLTWGCLNFSDNPAAVLKRPWIGAAVACWNPPRSREAG